MTFLLLLVAGIAAVAAIVGDYRGPKALHYAGKPLATLALLLLAALDPDPLSERYRLLVTAGLAASLAGDVFLMLPRDRFVAGLASFLVAHLLYIAAFVGVGGLAAGWLALPFAGLAAILLALLLPHAGHLRVPVMAYAVVIAVMAWLAVGWWWTRPSEAATLAAAGAILFLVSDAVLALDRFRTPFHSAQAVILTTYYLAQALIALSV